MDVQVYNTSGKENSSAKVVESVFGLPWNSSLVTQVVNSMVTNARVNYAHAKDRSDVSGGGIKPWRQKGTGRARHGSNRSPIWVGGGVTHGPSNETNYSRKVNRKMKAKALFTVLSRKLTDGEVLFVDTFNFDKPATRQAQEVVKALSGVKGFEALSTKRKNAAVIVSLQKNAATEKSFSNISKVSVCEARNLNVLDVLNNKYVVIENPEAFSDMMKEKKLLKNKTK